MNARVEVFDKRVSALSKRARWLRQRISQAEKEGRDLSHDKQELAALEWALELAEQRGYHGERRA